MPPLLPYMSLNTIPIVVKVGSTHSGLVRVIDFSTASALPATDYTLAQIKRVFDVNVFGVMSMCQAAIPLLRKSTLSGGARIITIGSICGMMPAPFEAAYNASKAAIHSYGDSIRIELEPLG